MMKNYGYARSVDQRVSGHFLRLLQPHDLQYCGSHVGQPSVSDGSIGAVGHVDARHRIERMGGVGGAVGIYGIVGIAVVGDDDHLIAGFLGGLDGVAHASVDSHDCLLDSFVDSGMAHHIAVGIVDHDEVELL